MRRGIRPLIHFCILLSCGFSPLTFDFANAQGLPNDDSAVDRVQQSHVEVIDRMPLPKKRQPAQVIGAVQNPLIIPADGAKKSSQATDETEPPRRDPPLCLTPPEIKEKNESRFTLDESMHSAVAYYLEVREQAPGHKILLFAAPSIDAKPIGEIETGDVILVEDSPAEYALKLKSDIMGEPIWRKVVGKNASSHGRDLWFQYTKRWMSTLSLNDLPFEMLMRPPRTPVNQPLYREAGFWNADDCKLDRSMCSVRLNAISRIYFQEDQFLRVDKAGNGSEWWSLFYKLGVYTPEDGLKRQRAAGWIEAHMILRRVDLGPACIVVPDLAERRETEAKEAEAESELFALNGNSKDPLRRQRLIASLGVPEEKLKNVTSISDLTLGYDLQAGINYITLDQPFAGPAYAQEAARVGLGVYSNLFVDLQLLIQGSLTAQLGSTNKEYGSSNLLDLQEWLIYTSPWAVNNQLVKIGVGAYYLSLLSNREVGGFKGFVGPQAEAIFGGRILSLGFRLAPVAQDLSFSLSNRVLGMSLTRALPWKVGNSPIQLSLEYTNLFYKNSVTGAQTEMSNAAVGLNFPF